METHALLIMTNSNIKIIIYYYYLYVIICRIMANWKDTNSHTTQTYTSSKDQNTKPMIINNIKS